MKATKGRDIQKKKLLETIEKDLHALNLTNDIAFLHLYKTI